MKTRELKFRAWNSKTKEFEFFELHNVTVSDNLLCQHQYPVQQFTGILDKNGKEVYEGDVIKYSRLFEASPNEPAHIKELTSFIRYEDAKFGFDLKGFNDMFNDLSNEEAHDGYNVEVIGNIFE